MYFFTNTNFTLQEVYKTSITKDKEVFECDFSALGCTAQSNCRISFRSTGWTQQEGGGDGVIHRWALCGPDCLHVPLSGLLRQTVGSVNDSLCSSTSCHMLSWIFRKRTGADPPSPERNDSLCTRRGVEINALLVSIGPRGSNFAVCFARVTVSSSNWFIWISPWQQLSLYTIGTETSQNRNKWFLL